MNRMKHTLVAALLLACAPAAGQTYSSLWGQADAALKKDLPKTAIGVMRKIETKASREKAYGQLLKAETGIVSAWCEISPDSLEPAVARLQERERNAGDAVLRSVYAAILYNVYANRSDIADRADSLAALYKARAVAEPAALAAARADGYEPFVRKGYNASLFGGDMLSVIGYETANYEAMHRWYSAASMRSAACVTALEMLRNDTRERGFILKKSGYIRSLDSLISVYADLPVACEAAIERYEHMDRCEDVTVEDRISYIHYALDKWGGWQRANLLREAERDLTASRFTVEAGSETVSPGKSQMLRLTSLRNVATLTMNVYKADVTGDTRLDPSNARDYAILKPKLKAVAGMRRTHTFMSHPDYQVFEDSIELGALPAGVYMLEFQTFPASRTVRRLYRVSDVFSIAEALPDGNTRYVVMSASTGRPLPGAKVRLRAGNRSAQNQITLTCDKDGEVIYRHAPDSRYTSVFAYTDGDRYSREWSTYGRYSYYSDEGRSEHTAIYTDRSIYRPGQTVHMSATIYEHTGRTDNKAVAGKTVTAVLRDANYKVVSEKSLTTDAYGTCHADFDLPSGKLGGAFVISLNNTSRRIRVEEYKRPTFAVEFPKVNEKYASGDTLMVKAKAVTYAGVPVQGASVRYTVRRNIALWWRCGYGGRPSYPGSGETVYSGDAVTGSDGAFSVELPLTVPETDPRRPMFYNFVVEADVTDAAGETRSGSLSVPLGTRATAFSCDLPDKVLADSLRAVRFSLKNAAGMDISAKLRFTIDNAPEWQPAVTGVPVALGQRFASGRHTITAICEGDTLSQNFIVFSAADTVPCVDTRDWFYTSSESFPADGSPVTVQVGTSDSNVHVVYSILSGNRVIEKGSTDISNSLINRKFTYREEYGDGLLLTFAWVRDGVFHSHDVTIRRPLPDRRLRMKWTTFRDRLKPGQQEEWALTIVKPDGTPADASLVATLYDKSLDQIARHDWAFEPYLSYHLPYTSWLSVPQHGLNCSAVASWRRLTWQPFAVSCFDDAFLTFAGRGPYGEVLSMRYAVKTTKEMKALGSVNTFAADAAPPMYKTRQSVAKAEAAMDEAAAETVAGGADGGTSGETVQLRENLSETAFFYPAVTTDKDGGVTLRFTLPESLTTWRFMGVAHTADMFAGKLEGEAVATKDIMVQPNVPRFIRMGDKASIAARIFNTGEADAAGQAVIELIDPETEKTVHREAKPFTVKGGETAGVAFSYTPEGTRSLLICRIIVSGKGFSDGEQHYLPVLPDRERVTVTVPFTQNGPGVKTIDISKLIPAGDASSKLTVEYTGNPAWLVVQALPSVGTPRDDNAVEQAAALYANAVGRSIIVGSPRVKGIFGQWRMERGGETSLMSGLEKNASLKDLVLDETPWVADADREADQKRRLGDFFDETLMQTRISDAVEKLQALQRPDGSWSWYPGMEGSFFMTVDIARTLTRLNVIAGRQSATAGMLGKAYGYIDKEVVREVAEMKKAARKGASPSFPGTDMLQYLYMNAISGRTLPASARTASDYLISLLKKDIGSQTIHDKALTAIILARHGETARSREYVRSLKEYSVYTEEMGRYYDTRRAAYSWRDYKIPTEVAAIEAIMTVTPGDTLTVGEMRRWLLQQKRTQAWDTPVNSVDAVYGFLRGNSGVLDAREQTVLAIDGRPLAMPQATAGIGYVKTSITGQPGRRFTATKTSQGTSWGALYAQYMQKTSEVTASSAGISVKREIISACKTLTVGSRVKVRITVKADRDLDFVQVTDRRAACMEPVSQLSGYSGGMYVSPRDNATCYYFDRLPKGKRVIETEYYIDRAGVYETGTCTAGCAYAPEYRATAASETLKVSIDENK